MMPHHFYKHENYAGVIVAVYTPMGRTLEAYLHDNGIIASEKGFIKTKVVCAFVMADVIRGFLTMAKHGYYAGVIVPEKIYFSQEYMNAFLYPTFGLADGEYHVPDGTHFPYYARNREHKISVHSEILALGFLYLQMRLQGDNLERKYRTFNDQLEVYASIRDEANDALSETEWLLLDDIFLQLDNHLRKIALKKLALLQVQYLFL